MLYPKDSAAAVVGLGASTVDILGLADHFPHGDEAQQAREVTLQGGGPVATALVALARLGVRTAMLDAVGDDWRGRFILAEFQKEGVEPAGIRVRPGHTSPASLILVKGSGERSILWAAGSAPPLEPSELPAGLIQGARFLHLNGRHPAACAAAAREALDCGVEVSFDGGAHRYRPELDGLIALSTVCIVARQFATACTGLEHVTAAAAALQARGAKLVVVTGGVGGSWVFPPGQGAFHQPAFEMPQVVDTTGCGDCYHGAFLYGLLQGWDLPLTARFASAAAALNTQALGGRAGLPDLARVEAFLSGIFQARPIRPPQYPHQPA